MLTSAKNIDILQWQIQDFPEVGAPIPQGLPTYAFDKFPKNCMKLKELDQNFTM